jgi:SAM-dependent methyltransferase
MDDRSLLAHYLARRAPEAQRWNLSPQALFLEYATRRALLSWCAATPGMRVCNVGIGAGDWDDFLGFWLEGKGSLSSLDIDPESCDSLRYRQAREGHPNPADIYCRDVLLPWPGAAFDLVTIIGSTLHEIGDAARGLDACAALLAPHGSLFYMDFDAFHAPSAFAAWSATRGFSLRFSERHADQPEPFSIVLAQR